MNSYFGGKSGAGTYQTIINQIPYHDIYIEGFLGMGGILRNKRPARKSIGLDLNSTCINEVINFGLFPGLVVKNTCAISFLELEAKKFGKEVFIYLDPPYPLDSRKDNRPVYKFELSDQDHLRILTAIKALNCNIAISTYPNKLYNQELSGWRKIEFESSTRQGMATENLYMNYGSGFHLHDDRYLGANSGTRQDIKRRIERSVKGIMKWKTAERLRFLRELAEELPESEKEMAIKFFDSRS
ncbi:DNA adenine methylase [Candidatus Pacearchaeota archaeon]|nr:DNA adenine methylase [Candidatus Pacearchaeota archaeon]